MATEEGEVSLAVIRVRLLDGGSFLAEVESGSTLDYVGAPFQLFAF